MEQKPQIFADKPARTDPPRLRAQKLQENRLNPAFQGHTTSRSSTMIRRHFRAVGKFWRAAFYLTAFFAGASLALGQVPPRPNPPRPAPPPAAKEKTYSIPVVPAKTFEQVLEEDTQARDKENQEQKALLESRYDLSNKPSTEMMSGGRKAVQQGVRVRPQANASWEQLARMTPAEIKAANALPMGFRPLPHSKHESGGMVFPKVQIDAIAKAEARDLQRFDTDFDLPDHLTPEFPPPMFLTNRPDLGDVSQGQVLTIKNFFTLMDGKLTPVQMEGLRLLLTPFPQQQFNPTDDRKTKNAELGVTCFDCHVNGHTNATFHLNPDTRPQQNRFRIETVSLRGMFNQQIHGSKRSLRSIEDFTEFEQRTAYFDGDHVTAAKKGVHLPDRASQVAMMAQLQTMLDFPPAPKLDVAGRLDPQLASQSELRGEALFRGKARCAECHSGPFFIDHLMHDLRLERFYKPEMINGHLNAPDGPIKTFTLRGIKDSPPYLHDGRLLTLDDTVGFFNLVLGTGLTAEEKRDLVAFMLAL
jgi:cytochrome c peroxidase